MIYDLRHKTIYAYENPVASARCVLRMTPCASAEQILLEHVVSITPAPARRTAGIGPFGEQTLSIVIDQAHTELVVDARSRVDVQASCVDLAAPSPAWEAVRAASLKSPGLDPSSPAVYLFPTDRTPIVAAITDYARISFPPGRPIVEAAAELMRRIKADFTYDPKATDVTTPPDVAFAARHGVCQDFAHVMISGLKGLGLPAAYVSGYLRTQPPPGRPRLAGADATHAWVSAWCGAARGWIGLDPTNAIPAEGDHIVLAKGRDYADVAPIEGVILAPGEQTLEVEVDVIPEDERLAS